MGVQAWTFNSFTAMEAVERAAATGAKNIELFPGQKVGSQFPGIGMGPDMTPEATQAFKAQLQKFGVSAVAYGVTGIDKNEAGARKLFAWAKSMGIEKIWVEELTDCPHDLIKDKGGRVLTRQMQFIRA